MGGPHSVSVTLNFFRSISVIFCLAIAFAGSADSLLASGTYPPAPPRLRADVTKEIDPEAYNLGKLIYAGRAKLASAPLSSAEVTANRETLTAIASRLPDRAREKLDIEQLSQQLNTSEEAALIYYLQLRFRIGEVAA
ncbi:MAG: hypothetical protein SynsKO_41790 [Synoicihabitans sp.]